MGWGEVGGTQGAAGAARAAGVGAALALTRGCLCWRSSRQSAVLQRCALC